MSGDPILAVDIGGTKMLAALVSGARVDEERDVATPRDTSAEGWCDALAALVADWAGRYRGRRRRGHRPGPGRALVHAQPGDPSRPVRLPARRRARPPVSARP